MKIKGEKSIPSRTKSTATKSKLAPKSKPLKKVHQKSVDEVHPKKDRKRERYRPEIVFTIQYHLK
jgi:hypothetical protein